MAVRAVKGTVFSTALETTGTTAKTKQDKYNVRKADSYRGLALVSTKQNTQQHHLDAKAKSFFKEGHSEFYGRILPKTDDIKVILLRRHQ